MLVLVECLGVCCVFFLCGGERVVRVGLRALRGEVGCCSLCGGGSLFLLWCGWVFCVRMVVHSLFGLVTMLRFFSVLHIGIPLLAFRAGGGFLCPGFGIGVVVLRLQSV